MSSVEPSAPSVPAGSDPAARVALSPASLPQARSGSVSDLDAAPAPEPGDDLGNGPAADPAFDLDVVTFESTAGLAELMRLTDDGCGSTCESACTTTCP